MRFKVGDLAKVAVVGRISSNLGREVTILKRGPWSDGESVMHGGVTWTSPGNRDYIVDCPGRNKSGLEAPFCFVSDWQLRPIDPPAEPKSLTRSKEKQGV